MSRPWTIPEDAAVMRCDTRPEVAALAQRMKRHLSGVIRRWYRLRPDRKPKPAAQRRKHRQPVRAGEGVQTDKPLDRPERPCANCGNPFQPTIRRRMLCSPCFSGRYDPMHHHG